MTTEGDGGEVVHGDIHIEITPATVSPQRRQQPEQQQQQPLTGVDGDDEFDYGDEYFTTKLLTNKAMILPTKQQTTKLIVPSIKRK